MRGGTKSGAGKGCAGSQGLTQFQRRLTRTAWKRSRRHPGGRRHESYAAYCLRVCLENAAK
jgi:hypothetical protein